MQKEPPPAGDCWGAVIGAISWSIFLTVLLGTTGTANGGQLFLTFILYLPIGAMYGFGFAFANWHLVMKKTAQGFIEGTSVLGIGIVLSALTDNKKYGMFGWLFFLIRVSWHIGFCWIPGIYYGVKAIRAESRPQIAAEAKGRPFRKAKPSPPSHAPDSPDTPCSPAFSQRPGPLLTCTGGLFAGNAFPFNPGEEIFIGSDPEVCQIIFPENLVWPIHCSLLYNGSTGSWRVRDLSGGNTYRNGVHSLPVGQWQELPRGTLLSIGQGKNGQRFQLN